MVTKYEKTKIAIVLKINKNILLFIISFIARGLISKKLGIKKRTLKSVSVKNYVVIVKIITVDHKKPENSKSASILWGS